MKTERLYYNDPYLLEFDASVIETLALDGRFGVVLDRTAFYPTSGGQPNDLGTINNVTLVDCYDDEKSGAIVHVLPSSLSETHVHCRVDAARRSDHMQQHSGQHVLSQAFLELFGWPTVSFHLGTTTCTIDLAADAVTHEQASKAEDLANKIIQDNRTVSVRYLTDQNIAEAGLRKPVEKTGEIRVIDIDGFDKSACGGTHVRQTGEIGSILLLRLERAKKQTRVEFICGGRVLRYAREASRALEAVSQIVSVPPLEAAAGVRTVWERLEHARKRMEEQELRLIDYEAAGFPVESGLAIGSFNGRGIEVLKLLAIRICKRPSILTILADESDQIRIVIARSEDCPVDAAFVLKQILGRFGGRGGGKANLAQGGGLTASGCQEVLEFAKELIAR
jgi:alanyl-tRNA synthetase